MGVGGGGGGTWDALKTKHMLWVVVGLLGLVAY